MSAEAAAFAAAVNSADAALSASLPVCFCRCGTFLNAPVQLSPCGHDVCPTCAKECSACPVCHVAVDYKKEDTSLGEEIKQAIVNCPNYSEDRTKLSCRFKGTIDKVREHLITECPWTLLPCPNAKYGCKKQLPRMELIKHVKICPSAPSICRYCGQEVPTNMIFKHEKECRSRYIKCTFCGEMILRTDLVEHVEQDCNGKPTECPICYCDQKLKRGELQSHLVADGSVLKKHNQALARLMLETASGIEDIRDIISDLKKSIVAKRQKLRQLDKDIALAEALLEEQTSPESSGAVTPVGLSHSLSASSVLDYSRYDQSEQLAALQRRLEAELGRRAVLVRELEVRAALVGAK